MTDAERLFFLMLCRIPSGADTPATISDATWEKWTGLKPRMKELAIAGLRKKGLEVRGRGNKARFYWNESHWTGYIETHSREEKARTEGRKKSVAAKPGMQIHPDCSLKGCQKLCDTQACEPAKVVSISTGNPPPEEPQFAQPVAQTACNSKILKDRERKGETWNQSLQAVQNFFPTVDLPFIKKLLLAAKQRVNDFTDEQLAQAITAAHRRHQRSEGLFLQTVPGALVAILEARISQPKQASPVFNSEEIQKHAAKAEASLRKAGMDDLALRVHLLDLEGDFEKLNQDLLEIEGAAIERLRARAPVDVIRAAVEPQIKQHGRNLSAEQMETLRQQFINRKLLEDAGIARMSLYYL